MHRRTLAAAALLAVFATAGCRTTHHGAAAASGQSPSATATGVAAGGAQPDAFCRLFATLMPGLSTRLAALDPTDKASMDAYWSQAATDYQQMESVAPGQIHNDIDLFRRYATTRDDNLVTPLPAAGNRINAYAATTCHIDPFTFGPKG